MQIFFNGRSIDTSESTVFAVCAIHQGKDLSNLTPEWVIILNGFSLSIDQPLNTGDEVFMISRKTMPPQDQLEAMMAARHTPGVHHKLKQGRVGIAGLGGLGSNIAISLARLGVGFLLLVDFDVVEPSNLNRQHYQIRHLGQYKTHALKQQIEEINPFIQVKTKTLQLEASHIQSVFSSVDILCEAFDNPASKAMLVSTALQQLQNVQLVASSGMAGFDSANQIATTKKLNRLYICGDQKNQAEIGNGLMAPRVQICAGHQANMVLRLLLGLNHV